MAGHDHEDAELRRRRATLDARIAEQRVRNPKALPDKPGQQTTMTGAALGLKLASEFVAGVLVGAGLGYLLDRVAGTQPFGLIVLLLFGFAAGVLNVLRAVGRVPPAPDMVPAPPKDRKEPED